MGGLSLAAIGSSILSIVGSVTSAILVIIKWIIIILVSLAFLSAIRTILGLLGIMVSSSFIGEFFSLISMYLPFDASAVFTAVGGVISGILTFLIARKIFNLYKEVVAAV